MGRSLISAEINYNNTPILIANSHFESEFKSNMINVTKIKQYTKAYEILKKHNNVIFCSDCNITQNEETIFFKNKMWKDTWEVNKNDKDKYTYDFETNYYLENITHNKYKTRIDRILYKTNQMIVVNKFQLVIIEPNKLPSDHHGIYVEFAL